MNKNLSIAAALGAIAVILGAFASHSLQETLTQEALKSTETAVRYQLYHIFAVLIVNLHKGFSNTLKNRLSILFFFGILFFSGSIYAIYLVGISAKSIWFITPFGGLLLIIGWLWMSIAFLTKKVEKSKNKIYNIHKESK